MREELGYPRYHAQGGDWGAGVTAWLALDHAASVKAIHLNYLLVQPDAEASTETEKAWRKAALDAQGRLGAYADLQGTKPLSLNYAMADEPVAQLAWLVERFHDWADLRERSFEDVFSKDRLLTNALFYLATDAFGTATWYYAGAREEGARRMPSGTRITVPTAFAAYPDPRTVAPPREWVERGYAVTRWRDMRARRAFRGDGGPRPVRRGPPGLGAGLGVEQPASFIATPCEPWTFRRPVEKAIIGLNLPLISFSRLSELSFITVSASAPSAVDTATLLPVASTRMLPPSVRSNRTL